ncbi:peptidoglycan-binding domain-containing protein [Microlunatus speluncae]|uniref:peptidoglycan-binding domain-containing protein n=1 Tax=Microlunatus speluncae TaxID=2594267 RepID=UPI00126606EC|nr:peptidoglycan-binding domain-containing protein [Microlunatus speluncae]
MKQATRLATALASILCLTGLISTTAATSAAATTLRSGPVTATAPIVAAATPHCNTRLAVYITSTRQLVVPSYNQVTRNCIMNTGARGSHVWELQTALRDCYHINPGPIDGKYGPLTKAAVAVFQQSVKIKDDGVYGPRTEDFMRFRVYDNRGAWAGWCTQ